MLSITYDLTGLDALAQKIAVLGPALQEELRQQLLVIQSTWIEAVSGRMFPGMAKPVRSDRYAASIAAPDAMEYPFDGDPFHGRVIATDQRLAGRIERGYASFDMKPSLLAGPASKVGQDGTRYTTVPFTHSTPGSVGQKGAPMAESIYAQAAKLPHGGRLRLEGEAATYGLRSKLPAGVNLQATARGLPGPMVAPYTWKVSPYESMVRAGKAGHTTYRTFRRVSERSDPSSWIHPGQPPNPVVQAVRDYVEPGVKQALEAKVHALLG